MKKFVITFAVLILSALSWAQNIKQLHGGTGESLRGLSAVSDKIIWVSGSKGTVGKSVDGGDTWMWLQVKTFEKIDFRDIEAFDENNAILMGIGSPAYILRTDDGGKNWKIVYENSDTAMFLDAISFFDHEHGVVVGDPISGKLFIAQTSDGRQTWTQKNDDKNFKTQEGEACFASSGSNIVMTSKRSFSGITGGMVSHFYNKKRVAILPMQSGKQSTGANSLAINGKKVMIAGGDFTKKDNNDRIIAFSRNGGRTFHNLATQPAGYRSCVVYMQKKSWLTCGLNGVDITNDDGRTWHKISEDGFHVASKAKSGSAIFLAGSNGRIAKLN